MVRGEEATYGEVWRNVTSGVLIGLLGWLVYTVNESKSAIKLVEWRLSRIEYELKIKEKNERVNYDWMVKKKSKGS